MNKSNMSKEQMALAAKAFQNAKDIQCKCGSSIFSQGNKLKRLSKLITGEQEDSLIPIPALYCIKCLVELNLEDNVNEVDNKNNEIVLDFSDKIKK